jgi:hypothetical protein
MQCVKEELKDIICNYFTLSIPTHLCAFNTLECLGNLPDSASEVASSKYKFVVELIYYLAICCIEQINGILIY